jgi:chromosomal replication initiator protein
MIKHKIKPMNLEQLWQSALAEIELQISRPNFVTWLKNSQLIEKKGDGTFIISLPNKFAKEWVENKYHKIILGALRELDGETKKINYLVYNNQTPVKNNNKKGGAENGNNDFGQLTFQELKVNPETNLNSRYTLNSFIVGSSNELATAAALAVIEEVGTKYNPLFIYGGVGVGKTHLIQAVGNEIINRYKNKIRVKYVPSEKFINEVIWGMRNKRMESIKEKYRLIDVLIIDDIQFIGGKQKTEEEFFHTFNALYENNKQIIVSSDRSPRFLPTLEERLRSRFEGGMIADIACPDYELKMAVLKTKLQIKKIFLNDEVVSVIANKIQKSLREAEGILNRIIFYQQIKKIIITPKIVEQIINEVIQEPSHNITFDQIIKTVSEFFEVSPIDIIGHCRKKELVLPRQITIYLTREVLDFSYPYIAERLGKRDHTTAIYAYEKILKSVNKDQSLNQKIIMIKDKLTQN